MNNSKINNNLEIKSEKIKWTEIQSEMKNKLGVEIYESWLKKIIFVEEFSNYLLTVHAKNRVCNNVFLISGPKSINMTTNV